MTDDPDDRLKNLDQAIKNAQKGRGAEGLAERDATATSAGMASGMRAGGELIGGIIGGVLFGACADWMFGMSPVGVVVGTILGVIAGFYGVYRATL